MRLALRAFVLIVLIGFVGIAVSMRTVSDDPAIWHVDPATAERTGRDNDYLVAPGGATRAAPDRVAETHALTPRDLLFLFDAVARPAQNVEVVAGSVEALHITYAQRSTVFGFPDYITVKAIEMPRGAALIVWSRSRFGSSDFGVNERRVEGWLAQIGGAGG